MFKFLRKVFGKDGAATAPSESRATVTPVAAAPKAVENSAGNIEVASLSLRAILEKLPPDLQAVVNQLPGPEAKIVLPVTTILKQLANGGVKMSLASLLRQAPAGTFRKAQIEEKQMVDVPLAEIFKSVDPARLGRRAGQRKYDVPDEAVGLFGNNGETRSVASPGASAPATPSSKPAEPVPPRMEAQAVPVPEPVPVPEAPRVLRMPGVSAGATPSRTGGDGPSILPTPPVASAPERPVATKPAHTETGGDLVLPLVELAAGWPEGIRGELSVLGGDTKLVLPSFEVSAGLQKGRVSFPWSQIRGWLRPAFSGKTGIPDDYQMLLPLRIVAPAFVAATGSGKRKNDSVADQTLPDFFGPASGQNKPSTPAEPVAAAAPAPAAEPAPSPAPKVKLSLVREGPVPAEVPAPAPVPSPVSIPASAHALTLQELFNQPGKSSWTPAELISNTCELPGVAGAVIALEEGLVVAQKLPEGLAAETFAAFMPQIFGRLERYTQEMQLGEVAEIAFQSSAGPCQLFRMGKIFFATLGRTGALLPSGLKLILAELADHQQ